MSGAPVVTVLIPARNEEADIERCLRAVLAQDHPHDRMEIVLVDGGSTDGTHALAAAVLAHGDVPWKIVDNPTGTTPRNLNAGLAVASGGILCRVDARSVVPAEYVRLCGEVLTERPEVAVTGGAQVALARDDSAQAIGIARALNNRYAMGGARYRSGAASGPSDTVYLGAFRTEELRDAGGWDEYFETNQDYELNRRMGRRGLVWFDSRLEVGYVPRASVVALAVQYHRFGRWKVRYWRRTGDPPRRRQVLPILLVGALVGGAGARVLKADHRLRAAAAVVGMAGCGLVAVDHVGVREPARTPARAAGAVMSGLVAASWIAGVARESLARS